MYMCICIVCIHTYMYYMYIVHACTLYMKYMYIVYMHVYIQVYLSQGPALAPVHLQSLCVHSGTVHTLDGETENVSKQKNTLEYSIHCILHICRTHTCIHADICGQEHVQ